MSQSGIGRSPTTKDGRPKRNEPRPWVQGPDPGVSLSDTFLVNYQNDFEDYIEESWLPSTSAPWSTAAASLNVWSHDASQIPMSFDASGHESTLYASRSEVYRDRAQPNKAQYEDAHGKSIVESLQYQPHVQSITQITPGYGSDYRVQSPQTRLHQSHTSSCANSSFHAQPASEYSNFHAYNTIPLQQRHTQSWSPAFEHPQYSSVTADTPVQSLDSSSAPSILDLPTSRRQPRYSNSGCDLSFPLAVSKRRPASTEPATKKSRADVPQSDLSEFVIVFENSPGALASVKRRRKLDAPVRKAAKDVRKAGACHQCRFRKRTVSPSIIIIRA
jgi:hypothetical protein